MKKQQFDKDFDLAFPKSRGKEYEHFEGEHNYQFLRCIPTGRNSWRTLPIRGKIKSFIFKLLESERKRVINFISYDMNLEDEEQRKAVVELYLEHFGE